MLSEFDKRSGELGEVIGANGGGEGRGREGKRREMRRKWGWRGGARCKVDRLVGVFNSMISAEDDKPY